MKKLKIAQIGIGHDHAPMALAAIRHRSDLFDVVGYALPDIEKEKFADLLYHFDGLPELTVEQIMADPTIEAVVIETEEVNLTRYALMAAKAGKHIHMDKPGGIELADFEEMIEIMRSKNLIFHPGYMYRYNPEIIQLLERVRNGELGEIFSVEAHMDCRHTPEKRQWLGTFPGGMMFFLGCHLIDLLLQLRGMPDRIIPLNRCTGVDGVTAEDYGMVIFDYKNGVSFAKTCAEEVGGFARRQLAVTGSKETVELRPLEMGIPDSGGMQYTGLRFATDDVQNWHDLGKCSKSEPFDRYEPMMVSFCKMALGEKENPISYDYELTLYKTLLKCCGVE